MNHSFIIIFSFLKKVKHLDQWLTITHVPLLLQSYVYMSSWPQYEHKREPHFETYQIDADLVFQLITFLFLLPFFFFSCHETHAPFASYAT